MVISGGGSYKAYTLACNRPWQELSVRNDISHAKISIHMHIQIDALYVKASKVELSSTYS